MKVIADNQIFNVVKILRKSSISNGTDEAILRRDSDGLITVKSFGLCQIISSHEGKFVEKTAVNG